MKRRLPNLLTAVSLLLFVAVAGLWVRSYWASDWIAFSRVQPVEDDVRSHVIVVCTGEGKTFARSAHYVIARQINDVSPGWHAGTTGPIDAGSEVPRRFLGFGYVESSKIGYGGTIHERTAAFPLWAPAALFALPPCVRLCRGLRRRARPGLCPRCGYDLRATPRRRPECGSETEPA